MIQHSATQIKCWSAASRACSNAGGQVIIVIITKREVHLKSYIEVLGSLGYCTNCVNC